MTRPFENYKNDVPQERVISRRVPRLSRAKITSLGGGGSQDFIRWFELGCPQGFLVTKCEVCMDTLVIAFCQYCHEKIYSDGEFENSAFYNWAPEHPS